MPGDRHTKRLLWMLFAGSRGGPVRLRIISHIRNGALNTNQIASAIGMDYKGAQHHMRVLERNTMVSKGGDGYGAAYSVSALLEANMEHLDAIIAQLEKRK